MKICRFLHNNIVKTGFIHEGFIIPNDISNRLSNVSKNEIYENEFLDFSEVIFLAPTQPSKIVCVGRNYVKHAAEMGNKVPEEPLLFLKAPSSIILDGEQIEIPNQSNQVEHEGELAFIIKQHCKNLSDHAKPEDFILGYICLNDVTARDIQRHDVQFTRGKSFDTFCPISIFAETDLDVSDLQITTKINGVVKQSGRTSEMVFSVSFLLKYISRQMTLYPGDIIATGTPSGVSKLSPADLCEIEIEGVGVLKNIVRT